ncbi:GNAT family N-acetyltransferase [Terribacillus saccharophilus]|uniref:GNAT family N-acetyltransferase n=1 Tax=Terribacillus saccharophilus TaxID=361277 RepID=A0A268HDH0_9BACI|nr:GNAT family N-acetyltransferase [Terribacillus saccharophilus]PAD34009.1 GNAT family N-acetyltransferase [Terribacillus saccharophilus]PAD94746.1 GNAT family N-acetyltransferase [Terribacillus saccharophilus]PAD98482.1 GNAT family N-acetyltransferase [Terribacillus saccharophilus]PAE07913.1 GNAT family N-acetyltransferase [Terribacillus saccharophilus]
MKIRKLHPTTETPPMDLLLEADPSITKIESYLRHGSSFIAEIDNHISGIYVLLPTSSDIVEVINISVREADQGKGIGRKLIHHAIEQARAQGYTCLEVGTGNSSIDQIAFYQKCGFRMIAIDHDFFLRNYERPIFENGIQCRDMIRFRYNL